MRLALIVAAMMVGAPLLAGAAAAQVQPARVQPPSYAGPKPQYEGVEQMVEDISPLSLSLRTFQTDLRLPSGFDSVYRMPDDGAGEGRLMRIDGALAATFPQSVYAPVYVRERVMLLFSQERKVGYVPTVPAGTVFHIGLPEATRETKPEGPLRSQPELHVTPEPVANRAGVQALAVERVAVEPATRGMGEARATSRLRPAIGTAVQGNDVDEPTDATVAAPMREERLRELLRRAVEAERGLSRP